MSREINTQNPTKIEANYSFDPVSKEYKVELRALQDGLVIEQTGEVTHDNFMSAKLFIDGFVDKFKHTQHEVTND